MESKNKYYFPLKKEDRTEYGGNSPAHVGNYKFAIDFTVPEGTHIYASLSGEVVFVKDDSNIGGNDEKYSEFGNRIVIKHGNNEYSAYEHIKNKGAIVAKNQKVKTKQIIGYSGNTGWSHKPHLHFEVFINPTLDKSCGETIPIKFENSLKRK
jgi:murein DD-endopeptidase MepM/ murein hydrolase activator NlpD